ncbi:MAG TPA: MBL fold metallo-hydrolase [Candidatus Acidoferrum sp.]|nr:MBL fold metallo-hydrolase [Candidatus Acidoferrum sp.]
MKAVRGMFGLALIICALVVPGHIAAKNRVTILYDAFSDNKAITKDWGFSALVEHDGKRILFDTGNDAATFEHNVKTLGVDISHLDFVVISHRHGDHTTGLKYLLSVNPNVPVYAPLESFGIFGGSASPTLIKPVASLPDRMRYYDGKYPDKISTGYPWGGGNFVLVDKLTEISPGIFVVFTISKTPGTLELRELSLALRGPNGLSLVVGCSHPGIEEILQASGAIHSHVHFLCGGLHLVSTPESEIDRLVDSLKNKWKIDKIAPGHCTGEPAFLRLKNAFGENYIYAGAGTTIDIP